MLRFNNLKNSTTDVSTLETFISANFQDVYDFFVTQKHSEIVNNKAAIKKYIALNLNCFKQLNISSSTNLSFISILLDVSERLGLLMEFKILYEHLKSQNYTIGKRLEAASLYLTSINTADDYLHNCESICQKLQLAYELEEDNEDRILFTIINYYAQVVNNFGQFNSQAVTALRVKITEIKNQLGNSFLNHPLIHQVLNIELEPCMAPLNIAYHEIQKLLYNFLNQNKVREFLKERFLIEHGTYYVELLKHIQPAFHAIRQLSVNQHKLINDNSVFYSLQRGVKILTEENQLYAYLNSYGNMHYQKIISSLESLPQAFFDKEISIIDWACGQGMATISFLDYLNNQGIQQKIKDITLIEPSGIALKRASLHVKKYDESFNVLTINKDIDSLHSSDFLPNQESVKLHLFSNVLDMEVFQLSNLLELIKNSFDGENYFICASPFVNDLKTERINSFVRYFSTLEGYTLIESISHRGCEWYNNWTRVIRVFHVNL
ncbi:hypothetical protein [Rufibacter sp. XAAS-G3-1]|uniref:hypothetical protein n=1 Tax=Rufibacter sp. XAAS-G3-1 TaxID=2729134 RepID=UPI0015E66C0F|nr:hypothetical protein [Rufibacter sp. XAAS-G3-1]